MIQEREIEQESVREGVSLRSLLLGMVVMALLALCIQPQIQMIGAGKISTVSLGVAILTGIAIGLPGGALYWLYAQCNWIRGIIALILAPLAGSYMAITVFCPLEKAHHVIWGLIAGSILLVIASSYATDD